MIDNQYRGKFHETGEWFYGYYVMVTIFPGYIEDHRIYSGKIGEPIEESELIYNLVDSETVGQFVGLTDPNAKNIFVGDVLVGGHEVVMIDGCFCGTKHGSAGTILNKFSLDDLLVIGNIHDH